MNVITKITIDLEKPSYPAIVNAVQGDRNTRCVEVSIYSGGVAWQIPSGVAISMRYSKPDFTAGYYDTMPDGTRAWSVQGNTISMQLAPQMLTVIGTVIAQLELVLGDAVLGIFSFRICVEGNPAVDIIASEDYINWLQWIEDELDKYINTVKESGEFHGGTLSDPVNMNGNRLYGLPLPVTENDAAPLGLVKRAAPRNLLDNSDFTNPVNQRNFASGNTVSGYWFDRWTKTTTSGITAAYNSDGITIKTTANAGIRQVVPAGKGLAAGDTVTFAICEKDGTVTVATKTLSGINGESITVGTGNETNIMIQEWLNNAAPTVHCNIMPQTTTAEIKWAALYKGEYTAETLPEYHPKGYAAELAECQRYYKRYGTGYENESFGIAVARNSTTLAIVFDIGLMRVSPTVTYTGTAKALGDITVNGLTPASDIYISGLKRINFTGSGFTPSNSYLIASDANGLVIEFSADL